MKFILLDRDGVINFDSKDYIKSAAEWQAIPGSLEAIVELNRVGYRVIVVTNQSGLARGLFERYALDEMHEKFTSQLAKLGGHIEEIFICPHHPDDNCECRKPKPGLFDQAKEKYQIHMTETYYIGDTFSDMQAAGAAGCLPILVLTGKGQETLEKNPELDSILHFENLAAAVKFILKSEPHE